MLSEREEYGVCELLERIIDGDLVQLANTVTNRLITVQNREEAVKAITKYTESAEQFLRRKLVKRDLLFNYLATKNITISPNADKSKIIQTILEYWQSTHNGARDEPPAYPSSHASHNLSNTSQENSELPRSQKTQVAQSVTTSITTNAAATVVAATAASTPAALAAAAASTAAPSPSSSTTAGGDWCRELAEKFSSWFFTQLNLLHPSQPAGAAQSDWGPQHFLSDASLKLCVVRNSCDKLHDTYEGPELVAKRLGCLVTEEQLFFNPNLTAEGMRGISEAHGLFMIAVCGTIHQAGTCIGLFEQSCGLVRDPLAENNWKVKFVNLRMKSCAIQRTPTLQEISYL